MKLWSLDHSKMHSAQNKSCHCKSYNNIKETKTPPTHHVKDAATQLLICAWLRRATKSPQVHRNCCTTLVRLNVCLIALLLCLFLFTLVVFATRQKDNELLYSSPTLSSPACRLIGRQTFRPADWTPLGFICFAFLCEWVNSAMKWLHSFSLAILGLPVYWGSCV